MRPCLILVVASVGIVVGSWPPAYAQEASPLLARAREEGAVRVLARLPVASRTLASRGTVSGDRAGRIAIRSARARLEAALGETAWRVTHQYDNVPYVALEVGVEALERLQASDDAGEILEDRLETIQLGESAPLVQSDRAFEAGYDGSGWTVAVLDTGVDSNHPFLGNRVVAEACFSANASCPNGRDEQFGPGAGAPCDYADSACLHGTHVAGVVAGDGQNVDGVARAAGVITIQVFSEFTGSVCEDDSEDPCAKTYTSDTIRALDHVYGLRDRFKIAAVNMSLGGGEFASVSECEAQDSARVAAIELLRSVGIATVAAAGNEGKADALAAPACIGAAISIGATNDDDEVAGFSNSASFLDLLAPGVQILSAVPGDQGAIISGTSQATPHVAGAFAVLQQSSGGRSVDEVLGALAESGTPIRDDRNGITRPRIQIFDAITVLATGGTRTSGVQITPDERRTLVSKDVGGGRWAITLNEDDGSVTGNVFREDGGEPTFVACAWISDDGNPDPYLRQVTFSCSGADRCTGSSCPATQWVALGTVLLPYSFFLPPQELAPVGTVGSAAAPPPGGVAGVAPSGLQIVPDEGADTLVSKDVGGKRWAITRHSDDATVTGNVFSPGEEPTFLWCRQTGDNGDPDPENVLLNFACDVADRCDAPPCGGAQWRYLQDVEIPAWFFLPGPR